MLQIKNPKFEISVMNKSQYPKNRMPQIVLAGKSNVGKSSFVNCLINRKSLARTSSEPGKTRQINFYNMDDIFYFVDLPGYGYSKMSKAEQQKLGPAIETFLKNSKNINLIILLVDIRHKPSENDKMMMEFIKSTGNRYIVVTSKADKIAKTKVQSYVDDIAKELDVAEDLIFAFSSETKFNKELISDVIAESLLTAKTWDEE
ncbi:MAG: YihA family ribosome biogenesis GTP-binding protein [Clostridia bacterium]|nr:YihA family ribosome biogenesis GTP-binding protein [Clostridia bacterium]